ncbi:MAG: helix-turn-helix domain containing protein [Acidimicrobiia bacterium]|nr:helix-turn-helix domain containing protein [Acidimicrobiia bacterium]
MAVTATISTRERILATAAELFARRGYSTASLQDVADRLGITKAALYYHFDSKDDILLTVLHPYFEAADAFLSAEAVRGPHELLTSYMDLLLEHRTALDVIAFDRSVLNHPEIGEIAHRQTMRLQELLVGSPHTMEREVAAAAALGAVRSATALVKNSSEPIVRSAVLQAALAALDTGVRP